MRILIFINSLDGGGAERVVVNLSTWWSDQGYDVSIVTLNSPSCDFYDVDGRVTRLSLEVDVDGTEGLAIALTSNVRRLVSLRRIIKRENPDLVLGVMTRASVTAILASVGLKCKIIATEHNHPPMLSPGRLWSTLRRLSYRFADEVVALTSESALWIKKHCRCERVGVIPNAVVWPIQESWPLVDASRFCKPGRKIVLAVGRLVPQKGFDYLLPAFASLAPVFPDWDLVILGEGPERERLEQAIAAYRLESRVVLPGRVGNVGHWYRKADIYVLSSRFEGFPMTLVEAMASNLPAVSFDCETGPRDIIQAESNGVLVQPVGDVSALATSLSRMMRDHPLREQLAEKAGAIRERYSQEVVGQMWLDAFSRIGLR